MTAFLIGDKTLAHQMVKDVANEEMPFDSAHAILEKQVGMKPEDADLILKPAVGFKTREPDPAPTDPTT